MVYEAKFKLRASNECLVESALLRATKPAFPRAMDPSNS